LNSCFFLPAGVEWFCSNRKEKRCITPYPKFSHAKELKVTINYFNESSIPWQKGSDCSERYAFDTMSFSSKNMVLFTDLGSMAIMKINYQLIFFKIDHVEIRWQTDDHSFFRGNKIQKELIFTSKEVKKIRDGIFSSAAGSLEIFKKRAEENCM
jgi:hypothetical protein